MRRLLMVLVLTMIATGVLAADNGKFSGYMFGDYYWVAADHDAAIEDANGFWFRRIYFTYDRQLDERTSARLRYEMTTNGDFRSKTKMTPSVKDAYVKRDLGGGHYLVFGISPTPTWEVVEHVWGYRSVEKTVLDLQKFGSSRDFGVALKGKLDGAGKAYYHVMVANGNSNASETNDGKKVMGAVGVHAGDHLLLEAYADHDTRPGHTSRSVVQGFAAWQADGWRLCAQYDHVQHNRPEATAAEWDAVSVFGAARVSDAVSVFGRYDYLSDPNPQVEHNAYLPFSPDARSDFFVGGFDWAVSPLFHVMPNVEVVSYGDTAAKATSPDTDVLPRITVFYKF